MSVTIFKLGKEKCSLEDLDGSLKLEEEGEEVRERYLLPGEKETLSGEYDAWPGVLLTGHIHRGSPFETSSDCGNCDGALCDDLPCQKMTWWTLSERR